MMLLRQNGWVQCPPGEFRQLENRLWSQWLGRVYRTIAVGVLATAAVSLAVWQVSQVFTRPSAICPTGPVVPCPVVPCPTQPDLTRNDAKP
jgi:hypothetical protein